jgi:hypothetical protein
VLGVAEGARLQAFRSLLDHFGLNVLLPIIAVGLVVASLSGLLD